MEKKVEKKKKMSGKKIAALCGVLAVIICVVFAVLIGGGNSNKANNKGLEEIYPDDMTAIITETEYCDLQYPQKWEDNLKVDVEKSEFATSIKYYGVVDGKGEQLLFEVCFGGDGEIPIGVMTVDGVSTDVGVTYGDPDLKDWTEEEKNTYYAMQEDVNYIIMQLEKEKGFERVE